MSLVAIGLFFEFGTKLKKIKDTTKKYLVFFIVTFSKMGIYRRGQF